MSELQLDEAARARLKQFHEDGIVWLVNTAILHPRGLALTIHLDEDGEPLGLSVSGEGDEPWGFSTEDPDITDAIDRYRAAEARREAAWSPRLRGKSR